MKRFIAISFDLHEISLYKKLDRAILEHVHVVEIRLLDSQKFISSCDQEALDTISQKKKLIIRLKSTKDIPHWLLSYTPWIIDIPYPNSTLEDIHLLQHRFPDTQIQLSYHSPEEKKEGDPILFSKLLSKMASFPVHSLKCALYPKSIQDTFDLLQLIKNSNGIWGGKNLTMIAMGDRFSFSRILGFCFGNFLTFTCVQNLIKAPGQIDIESCFKWYRLPELDIPVSIYALIGKPIDHSLSHKTHTLILHTLFQKPNSIYVKIELDPVDLSIELLEKMRSLSFKGISVTTPLKKRAAVLCSNGKTPINTISFDPSHGFTCANTDVEAVIEAISIRKPVSAINHVAIFGFGEVAEAIFHAFIAFGIKVDVFSRSEEKKKQFFYIQSYQKSRSMFYDLIINTTSDRVGHDMIHLIPPEVVPDESLVIEFMYPEKTKWLQEIEKRRCDRKIESRTISGMELWLRQAVGQFYFWQKASGKKTATKSALYDMLQGLLQRR